MLNMEREYSSKSSTNFYQTVQSYIPEDSPLQYDINFYTYFSGPDLLIPNAVAACRVEAHVFLWQS
jgi:hypothetical protein